MTDAVDPATNQPAAPAPCAAEPSPDERSPDPRPPEVSAREAALGEALAARDRFLGAIGHELRNSIAPMLLVAEQLQALAGDPTAPPALASRTAMLSRNLARMVTTIDRVTEVAALRRGRVVLDVTTFDLVALVAEVCGAAAREAAAAGAAIVVEAPAPVLGAWDRLRVRQIVSSLVSNAIRYGGGGAVELAVFERGADAVLTVRDHGPGIAPDALARLFAPFDVAPGARGTGGFGIGLWVVKTLCEAMAGSVTVENTTSGGARFSVVLPRG